MKKFIAVFMAVFIIVISVPSFSCLAFDLPVNGFVTYESIQGYDWGYDLDSWNGGVEGSGAKLSAFFNPDVIFSSTNSQLLNSGIFNHLDDIPVDLTNKTYIIRLNGLNDAGSSGDIQIVVLPDGYEFVSLVTDGGNFTTVPTPSRVSYYIACQGRLSLEAQLYNYNSARKTWSVGSTLSSTYSSTKDISIFYVSHVAIMSSDLVCYSKDYANWLESYENNSGDWVSGNIDNVDFLDRIFNSDYDGLKFNFVNLPFYNGSEIIVPDTSVVESNLNHLYLSNFDAGYCKPYHMQELYRAGGGYLYFTYDFDSWINSHSDDYQLQVITQLNVDGIATTYNSLWPLDLQGCMVLPFNRLASSYQWGDENILFIEYEDESLFSNYNKGYVYAINYLKYVDPNTQKGIRSMGNGRTRSFISASGSTHRLLGDDPAEENYFSGQSNHTQFLMSVTVRMVDTVSGDVSGSFTKTFNLLNGVSTVSNNQIRDNTNPYEPTSDDLYFPIQDSGGGYGYGGGNNQLVNFQFPSDIELFIDNGFKQFLSWYETSADTAYATNRFWSSMGIFEGNPATALYEEYFGFLPDDFKTLILSCAGIGIVGGAFCILRRRLH